MKRIDATLPALGGYTVPFYKESEEVLEFLGDKELRRLDRVQHFGIAAKVFTGVNHSRLEYVLLQCAVINMLPRFHKGSEQFGLSGAVHIPGQKARVSSGEELLKCWALLGNAGHAQYTYGVERSLLNWARKNPGFQKILLAGLPTTLRRWGLSVIEEYRDTEFHHLLILCRIAQLPARWRTKIDFFGLWAHCSSHLIRFRSPSRLTNTSFSASGAFSRRFVCFVLLPLTHITRITQYDTKLRAPS